MLETALMYDSAAVDLTLGQLRWPNDDFSAVLVSNEYRPRRASDVSIIDIGDAAVVEPVRLRGRAVVDTGGRVALRADDCETRPFTGEFRYVVVFNSRTGRLVAFTDLGPQEMKNGVALLLWPGGKVCELILEESLSG